jgi:ABC-type uncharacterized transport system involved in gliding motility auxiliary subunit
MSKKHRKFELVLYSSIGIVIMFVAMVAVNIIGGVVHSRIDLTEDNLYTLSPGTKVILEKLDTPVDIRFYVSQENDAMPVQLKNYARQVEDLLEEYEQVAGDKINIQKLDPQPDSDAEDSANMDGLQGQMAGTGNRIYLGLAVGMLDKTEAVPFLSPDRESLLEYDITRAISRVMQDEPPVIGVMTALPAFGQQANPMMQQMGQQQGQDPWVVIDELKGDYEVREVNPGVEQIDSDIKTLLVLHPKNLSAQTQFAIDQFVLRGGNLVAFMDPLSIVDTQSSPGRNPMQQAMSSSSTLDRLLPAWGVEFDSTNVVADMNFLTPISQGRGSQPQRNPAVLSVTEDGLNQEEIVTGDVDNILLAFAGAFSGEPAEGLTQTVLIHSTSHSQLVQKMMAQMGGERLIQEFESSNEEQPLALRLTGKFKTAFPDGKPAGPEEENEGESAEAGSTESETALKESKNNQGSVVLVGDVDLLYDDFAVRVQNFFGQRIVQPINGNLTLAQNLVDQMAGDENLIGIRSRATSNRPFTVVREMEREAEAKYRDTIRELEQSQQEAQQRLNELQRTKEQGQEFILSSEQQEEIKKLRKRRAEINQELKDVRRNLRAEIESLENKLKWVNIAGMPAVVTVFGIILALINRKRSGAK